MFVGLSESLCKALIPLSFKEYFIMWIMDKILSENLGLVR